MNANAEKNNIFLSHSFFCNLPVIGCCIIDTPSPAAKTTLRNVRFY